MEHLERLHKAVHIRWKMIIVARELLKPAFYLQQPDTAMEKSYIRRRYHLWFIGWALWRNVITETAKLFSNAGNQKHNMHKLLRAFEPGGDLHLLKMDATLLSEWNKKMQDMSGHIHEITRLRDKYFAHTDGDPFVDIETFLIPHDIEVMLSFAMEIISTLSGIYFGQSLVGSSTRWDSKTFPFIHILADLETRESIQLAKDNGFTYKGLTGEDLPEGYTE